MQKQRKIALVARKIHMHDANQSNDDMNFWLSKSPIERLAAVTYLVNQNLAPGQRMDKSKFSRLIARK